MKELSAFYLILIVVFMVSCDNNKRMKEKLTINCEKLLLFDDEESNYNMIYAIIKFKNNSDDTIVFLNKDDSETPDFLGRKSNFVFSNKYIVDTLRNALDLDLKIEPFMEFKQIYLFKVQRKNFQISGNNFIKYINTGDGKFTEGRKRILFQDSIVLSLRDVPVEIISKDLDFEEAMEVIGAKKVN